MFELGVLHMHGNGVATDFEKALQLYYQAAELGNAQAEFTIESGCYESIVPTSFPCPAANLHPRTNCLHC